MSCSFLGLLSSCWSLEGGVFFGSDVKHCIDVPSYVHVIMSGALNRSRV